MKILILSKDPSLLEAVNGGHIGDARKRHKFYANYFKKISPKGDIKIITYTRKNYSLKSEYLTPNLQVLGTCSFNRFFYIYDLLKILFRLLKSGYIPNVITTQTPWEEGLVGLVVSKIYNVKFIPQLHFDLFSNEWLNESKLNLLRKLIAFYVMKHSDRVRVVSDCLKNKLVKKFHITESRIYVAPVGVNFTSVSGAKNEYKAKISPILLNKKVILFVGRLCNQKNMILWLDVAKKISNSIDDSRFIVVGDGDKYQSLKEYAAKLGILNKCFFLGEKSHDVLPQIYAASDLFLLTSHYEGFGRVVLEAMKAGLPVVSTKCCGPEDLIVDKVNGYLVDANSSALAKKSIGLLIDDKKREVFSNSARSHVSQNFSLDVLTQRMVDGWLFD